MTKNNSVPKTHLANQPTEKKTGSIAKGKNDKSQIDKTINSGNDGNVKSNSIDDKKKNYVRGEAQKPVTPEYRNNWNAIFKK